MSNIVDVKALEILDSRGIPTVQATVKLSSGAKGIACVPSGASTGSHEAVELRDIVDKRYFGKGVRTAVDYINSEICDVLKGLIATDQKNIDNILIELDGTENKSRLGANSILAVSLAVSKASSNYLSLPLYKYIGGISACKLPVPLVNVINGGAHANNKLNFQEFMLVPLGADCFSNSIRWCSEIFNSLKYMLSDKGLSVSVGDEGGFAPDISSNDEAIEYLLRAIESAGYKVGSDVMISLDAASTEFYSNNLYNLSCEGRNFTSDEMVNYYQELCKKYPIFSIEDGMSEDDWKGWSSLTKKIGDDVLIVGDDLFVTNTKRLSRGISEKSANSILIKPNQIGTLTETLSAVNLAQESGFKSIISHRSGETEDTTIADIAVATNSGLIKTGSVSRSERCAKYNRLINIEHELDDCSVFG